MMADANNDVIVRIITFRTNNMHYIFFSALNLISKLSFGADCFDKVLLHTTNIRKKKKECGVGEIIITKYPNDAQFDNQVSRAPRELNIQHVSRRTIFESFLVSANEKKP